ncbi:hypothetical protein TRFO_05689 [Tritrichomonas foetus]|uniref:Uncharacterized protein n=1 Tax=Tritrichomonas foetus TaxID=1144522 RepID=A0A1J4K3U0_9EUKA|nr:hypothetical protein TRFO_05689 [Tritrichomonas foetus]|eukprot:OHT06047.1 hypothetical protein TRFO_05689 [Tritrichomonas foetus]
MFMFSPYENNNITAIGWSNGSSYPTLVQPLLAIALDNGKVVVYNFNTKEVVGKNNFNEKINCIKWSAFESNRLYIGTQNGYLYFCTIRNNVIEVTQEYKFDSNTIDFVDEDGLDGSTIAVAGKNGFIGCIKNIHKNRVHPQSFKINDNVNFFEFFPNHHNFLIVATSKEINLFSVHEETLVPFIPTPEAKFVSIPNSSDNQAIIGYDNSLALWSLNGDFWKRLSLTNLAPIKNQKAEILTYSQLDDKILVTTSSHWLTVIEEKRNKLFITERVKLLDSKPKDWDFRKGSIAFVTKNGNISITRWTPDSIVKQKFGQENEFPSVDDLSKHYYSKLALHEWSDLEDEQDHPINSELGHSLNETNGLRFSNTFVSLPYSSQIIRSQSSSIIDDSNSVYEQIIDNFNHVNKENSLESLKSTNTKYNYEQKTKSWISKKPNTKCKSKELSTSLCGNSNTLLLTMNVSQEYMQNIIWVLGGRLIAWNSKSLYLIDLKLRQATELLNSKIQASNSIITQVFFTKKRSAMCIVLDGMNSIFMTTGSSPKIIGTLLFPKCKRIIGSFSPKEDQVIFASDHTIYLSKFNSNCVSFDSKKKFTTNFGHVSFISWKKCGIIIGTHSGEVLLVNKELKITKNIYKGENEIKFVAPCANNSFVVTEINGKTHVCSNGAYNLIKGNVRHIRLANRNTFLVKYAHSYKLTSVAAFGKFTPLSPPCLSRCQLMLDQKRYLRELKNLKIASFQQALNNARLFGSTFVQKLLVNKENPNIFRNNIALLYKIVSTHSLFHSWCVRIALKIGEITEARDLLFKTDPKSKDYMVKMSLAALFDTKLPSESIDLVINNLIQNNRFIEAVDIILVTQGPKAAIEMLLRNGRYREAYIIIMLQKAKDIDEELVHKLANYLIEDNSILPALKLLSVCGNQDEIIKITTSVIGIDLSPILKWLD